MKAQMALLETFASVVLLAAVGSYLAGFAYQSSTIQGAFNFNTQNFLYDFSVASYANRSLNSCILDLGSGCMRSILSSFNSEYGLSGSRLTVNGNTSSAGSFSACRFSNTECYPVDDNSVYVQACLYACGGSG